MLNIKICPKNWHYCNWKSLDTSVNNHSSTCYREIRACNQIASLTDLFYRKEETRMLEIFSGR